MMPDPEDSRNIYLEDIIDLCLYVFSHVDLPGHTPNREPTKNTHQGLTSTTGLTVKYIRSDVDISISFNKHSDYVA